MRKKEKKYTGLKFFSLEESVGNMRMCVFLRKTRGGTDIPGEARYVSRMEQKYPPQTFASSFLFPRPLDSRKRQGNGVKNLVRCQSGRFPLERRCIFPSRKLTVVAVPN